MKHTIIIILIIVALAHITFAEQSKDIVIVSITDNTLDILDTHPILRNTHGIFLNKLYGKYKPSVVFIDLIIDKYCRDAPHLDKIFFEAVKGKRNIIIPAVLQNKRNYNYFNGIPFIKPNTRITKYIISKYGMFPLKELLLNGSSIGFINIYPDTNGLFDRIPTFLTCNNKIYCSAALMCSAIYLKVPHQRIFNKGYKLIFGSKEISVDDYGQMPIDFTHQFEEYEYHDIVNYQVPAEKIYNKILLYRKYYTGMGDYFPTSKSKRTNGTIILAHAIQTIINHK